MYGPNEGTMSLGAPKLLMSGFGWDVTLKSGAIWICVWRGEGGGIVEGMHSRDTEHQLCKVRADNVPSSADANFTSVVGSSHLGARSTLEAERRSGLKAQRGELSCALGLAVVARDSCGEGGRA
jgi:hypothetical protein